MEVKAKTPEEEKKKPEPIVIKVKKGRIDLYDPKQKSKEVKNG